MIHAHVLHRPFATAGLLASLLLASPGALAREDLDALAALTDETIRSACHGYLVEGVADRLAGWFGASSPLCRAVDAGEPPQAVIASLRAGAGSTSPGSADFRSLPDPIAMECDNDARCIIERRRARDLDRPMDMATFARVRSHCEQSAHRVYGVAQGVDGCIERTLADWPVLRLARPVRLLPMQGDFEVVGGADLREEAQVSAARIASLEHGRPLVALARSEDGQWLQVRDFLSGAIGFVQTASLRRPVTPAPEAAEVAVAVAAAPPPSLDIDALVRSGAVERRHHQNELERLEQQRREEEARLAAERDRLAREQAERERLAALQRQREQQQASAQQRPDAAEGFMRGLAGAAMVGLGAAAVSRGVPMDRAAEVVGAGLADIASGGESSHSVRVLEQAQRQAGAAAPGGGAGAGGSVGASGTPSVPVPAAAPTALLPNALEAAGRPRYRDCSLFRDPVGFDALALARMCNAAEQSYREYERVARSGADAATAQRAWEAHRTAAVNLMVFIDSQGRAKQANGF